MLLVLAAGCGSPGSVRDAALDALPVDASDASDAAASSDAAEDSPKESSADAPADASDARDAPTVADASAGCPVIDGVWSLLPTTEYSDGYGSMWAVSATTFLYWATPSSANPNQLRKWNGSVTLALPNQPPSTPFIPGWTIRGSGENDVWLGGSGPWVRTDVKDRLDVDVTHWDGVSWKDLTLVIPASPEIQNPNGPTRAGTAGPFWPVGPDEAWQWVRVSYAGAPATPPAAYHLEGGTWKAVPTPLDTPDAHPITMWGAAKNDVWVGGFISRQVPPPGDASATTLAEDPLLLHWDGSKWTRVELLTPNGNGLREVLSLWGTASNDVWAVGRGDTSADTWHFDGDRWTEVPVVGPKYFDHLWGSCAGDYWAVGDSVSGPWHYDGRMWSAATLPKEVRFTRFEVGLTGTSPGGVWMTVEKVGGCDIGFYPPKLAIHWGGNRCGDGVVAGGESCDPPRASGDGLRCDQSCQRPRCGNGVADPGEDCDPPNQGDGLQCDETCHRPTCGNGVVDAGEQCDPPTLGVCDRQCRTITPVCGDNIQQPGEECDFADPNKGLCNPDCTRVCFNNCLLNHPQNAHAYCGKGACSGLSGLDLARCWSVIACIMGTRCAAIGPGPAMGIGATTCFCKNGCDGSGDGPCAAAARALLASIQPSLDTTNPLVLVNETDGYGRFSAIVRDAAIALAAPTSNCTVNVCPGQR